jgi:4-diphosphocytidyl-2-C-methyl-D-erythritol kinase
MLALACAKLNLSLRVRRLRPDGFHDLHGLFQSISWHDRLTFEVANEDSITSGSGVPVPDGDSNSAMQAIAAVRSEAASAERIAVRLTKNLPTAAGLGGGSADAAAALATAARIFGVDFEAVAALAPVLGSDVPFCLMGGTALVSGRGELVETQDFASGYAVAVVVPPVELSTPAVYREWDRLGAPAVRPLDGADVPPSLRSFAPLANDLHPAAVSLAPVIDEWREELMERWGRPVMMSGSGPSLFGFFVDIAEATDALDVVPAGARAAQSALPVPFGWVIADGDTVTDSTGRRWSEADEQMRARFGL